MNIEVAVRIFNEDGTKEQKFVKRFRGDFDCTNRAIESQSRESFEDFLAGYLSASGYHIREQLLEGNAREQECRADDSTVRSGELEYTIKLGNGQFFTGRIPVREPKEIKGNSLGEIQDKRLAVILNEKETLEEQVLMKKQEQQRRKQAVWQAGEVLEYFMGQAIRRYEESFYNERIIDTCFIETS